MAHEIKTKFSVGEKAYILAEARQQGVLAGGMVEKVMIFVGKDGTTVPEIHYAMIQTLAFTPPGSWWFERELGTMEEAQALANNYHSQMAAFHDNSKQ